MLKGDRKLLQSSNNANVKPNAVVAQDSGGRYRIAAAALAAYLKNLVGRYVVVYVKTGVYDEYITGKCVHIWRWSPEINATEMGYMYRYS